MSEIVLRYEVELASMREGMLIAGQKLRMSGARRVRLAAVSVGTGFLIGAGGAVIGVLVNHFLGKPFGNTLWPALIGVALGLWLAHGWYDRLIKIMAGAVLDAPFNAGPHEMRFDARGVTMKNTHGEWRTDWAGVNTVADGPAGLHVLISGISLSVPAEALDETPKELAERLDALRKAAA